MKTLSRLMAAVTAGALGGCETLGANDPFVADAATPATADASSDEPRPRTPVPFFEGERYVLPDSHVNVLKKMRFTSLIEPGVALGFDLDGKTTPEGASESCGHGDLKGVAGEEGIDNQLAKIWSTLEPLVGTQVDALLQGAINEGRVLIMMELTDVDDLQNDEQVTLNVYRGLLDPEVGTFGTIAPDQTFELDYDKPVSTVEDVRIVDGTLEAGPVVLQIPVAILDLDIVAELHFGRVRLQIGDDGMMTGYIGGALNLEEVIGALLDTGAEAETRLVQPIFESNADMEPVDGVCTFISIGMTVEGTRAFVVRDRAKE